LQPSARQIVGRILKIGPERRARAEEISGDAWVRGLEEIGGCVLRGKNVIVGQTIYLTGVKEWRRQELTP
jgi:hypothetical protein